MLSIITMMMWTVSAQTEFVEPDEYICLADEDGGWTCALGKEPQTEPVSPQPPQEPQRWVQPEPHERSFPGGSDVRPLPLPVPSEPVQLAEPATQNEVSNPVPNEATDQAGDRTDTSPVIAREVGVGRDTSVAAAVEPVQTVTATVQPNNDRDTRPSSYWTIQIAALLNPDGVNAIAGEVGISVDELEVRTEQRLGKAWTVILLGQYNSAREATRAAQQRGLESRAWIRRVQRQSSSPSMAMREQPLRTAQAAVTEPASASVSAASATNDNKASNRTLSELPATHYTVQLASVDTDTGFAQLIEESNLANQPHWTHPTRRNGQSWYLLLWGQFSSLAEASAAIQSLPPNVRTAGPWPRRIGDILNELR